MVQNSLSFCLSEKLLISPSYLSEILAGYNNLGCMKRVASPGSMHDTRYLGLVHWDDPEGMVQGGRSREASLLAQVTQPARGPLRI